MQILVNRVRIGSLLVVGLVLSGFSTTATAQGFRGGDSGRSSGGGGFPSPEDSFRRMDRNQNGLIEPDEVPSFLREMYSRAGVDVSRPISQQDFMQASQKMREQFEQARTSGDFSQFRRPEGSGSPPSFGGGGPPSFGGGPPSFGGGPPGGFRPSGDSERRPDDSSGRDSRRDDRDGDRRRDSSSSSSSGSSKKIAKPKVRITKDLPSEYVDKDKNGDGQIGLYEWDRKAFAQFFELDRNGDGLLTASELLAAKKTTTVSVLASAAQPSSSSVASVSPSSNSPATTSTPTTVNGKEAASPASATPTTALPTTAGMKVFVGLDSNRDGTLTDEEWQRSRTARSKFEKAGIAISFPIQQAQFVEMYKKVEGQ